MKIPQPDILIESESKIIIMGSISVNAEYTSERRYTVSIPDNDFNDSIIEVRSSVLTKIRDKIKSMQSITHVWILDLVLFLGSICWGGWISYLQSNGTYTRLEMFIYGTLLFGIALASTIAFIILKTIIKNNVSVNADDLLEMIPDPQKAIKRK